MCDCEEIIEIVKKKSSIFSEEIRRKSGKFSMSKWIFTNKKENFQRKKDNSEVNTIEKEIEWEMASVFVWGECMWT